MYKKSVLQCLTMCLTVLQFTDTPFQLPMAKITACSDSSPLKKYKTSYPVAFPLSYFEDFILDERPQQMELVVSWLSIFYIKR